MAPRHLSSPKFKRRSLQPCSSSLAKRTQGYATRYQQTVLSIDAVAVSLRAYTNTRRYLGGRGDRWYIRASLCACCVATNTDPSSPTEKSAIQRLKGISVVAITSHRHDARLHRKLGLHQRRKYRILGSPYVRHLGLPHSQLSLFTLLRPFRL